MLVKAIDEFKKTNKVKLIDFSNRLKSIVEKYNERDEKNTLKSEIIKDFSDEIIEMYKALRTEMLSFAKLRIDFEEKAFYNILLSLAHKYDFIYPEDKLMELAKEVVDDKTKYSKWEVREDIKAELEVDIILLLDKYGYPPTTADKAYKEIFDQAKNFKKNRLS
jgi:type I restriction enzyme R subunit